MIKNKIFLYELKRAIFSKAFAFLMLLICAYSAYIIKFSVLFGYANTAPFSEWTFMNYLFSISPFLLTTLLFYISRLYSPYEKNVMKITASMPQSNAMYFFIKLSVTTIAYLLAALVAIGASFVFYGVVLDFYDYKIYIAGIAIILIPQLLFLQGIGIWLSRLQHSFGFILIAVIFLVSFFGLIPPYYFDVLGSSILNIPMDSIPENGVIIFVLPTGYIVARIILSILGIILIIAGCIRYNSLKTASV